MSNPYVNPTPPGGFPDTSNTPSDFGRSTNSRFRGRHIYPDGSYVDVARVPAGAGLTGWEQPDE
jgi:hypothetical protein